MNVALRLMIRGLGVLVVVVFTLRSTTSPAQTTVDPVEKLRLTLNTTVDNLSERDERTKACLGELQSLSELRKAVVLREWRHRVTDGKLAAIDQANRNTLAERFRSKTHEVLSGHTPGPTLAVLEILGETAVSLRALGEPAAFVGPLTADVALLVDDRDPAICAAAVLCTVDPDVSIALPLLTGLAKSPDPARRLEAASALGQMVQMKTQPWTAKEFNPATLSGHRATAESVAKLLPLASAGALDPNRDVRRRSLMTLALAATLFNRLTEATRAEALDLNEVRPLALVLQDSMKGIAQGLLDAEADTKGLALKVLEEAALGRRHWLQQAMVTTLPDDPLASGLAAALPGLATTLTNADVTLRRTTLDVLEIYGALAAAAVPAVTLALKDPDDFVRWSAVRTLGAIGPAGRPAIPALTKLLQDPDLDVRLAARVYNGADPGDPGTAEESEPADAHLAIADTEAHRAISNDEVDMRLAVMHTLALMGADARLAVPALAMAVRDPNPRVRLAAVRTLGAIGPAARSVAATLRLALKDDDAEVRLAAADALLSLEREP